MYHISVIVPIYGVELYIEQFLETLFNQTKVKDVQFILINDCTRDKSMEIARYTAAKYPQLDIVLHDHKFNQGVAMARQSGVGLAIGKYIIQFDPDDWLEPTLLETIYTKAEEVNADIVIFDFLAEYTNYCAYIKEDVPSDKILLIKSMLKGTTSNCLWNKLIRRSIFTDNNINVIPGHNIGEDLFLNLQVFNYVNTIAHVKEGLYHHRQRKTSITNTLDKQYIPTLIQGIYVIEKILQSHGLKESLWTEMMYSRIRWKWDILIVSGKDLYKYVNLYPETNDYIDSFSDFSKLNRFTFKQAIKGRLLLFKIIRLAAKIAKIILRTKY